MISGIRSRFRQSPPSALALLGPAGTGKTFTLAALLDAWLA